MMPINHGQWVVLTVPGYTSITPAQVVCRIRAGRGSNISFFFLFRPQRSFSSFTQEPEPPLQELSTGVILGDCVQHTTTYVNTTLEVSLLLLRVP